MMAAAFDWNNPYMVLPVVSCLLMLWPAMRICRRAGLSRWWGLLVLLPYFGILAVMIPLGHLNWPNLPPKAPKAQPVPSRPKRDVAALLQERERAS